MTGTKNSIEIDVSTRFLAQQSNPDNQQFAFSYTIAITNHGEEAVRLMSRHWLITDGNQAKQEVHGTGVVGEQPYINCGQTFEYTSGTVLKTAVGTMQGSYQMVTNSGEFFDAQIPTFTLYHPSSLH